MRRSIVLPALLALTGCGRSALPAGAPAPTDRACRDAADVQWQLPPAAEERTRLHAWCRAVGLPVLQPGRTPRDTIADTLTVASWNVAVGAADLREFMRRFTKGDFTGRPPRHFAVLLQEAHRASDELPRITGDMAVAGDIRELGPTRSDITDIARELGLHLVYIPNMRAGNGLTGLQADRGNAILSDLPRDVSAIELPIQSQRRLAVTAMVSGATRAGAPWRVQLTSIHFDRETTGAKNPERGRLHQAQRVSGALPDAPVAVLAGDVNTWLRGPNEAAVNHLRQSFPATPARLPPGPTYSRARGALRQYLDYMFFRAPGTRVDYHRVPTLFGSDHYPLVAELPLR